MGKPPLPAGHEPVAAYNEVTPEYFAALRIPLKGGRYFTARDNASAARVAIISEGMARQFYPNENPLGQRLKIGSAENKPAEIVGIVGDVRDQQLEEKGRAAVYQPAAQAPDTSIYFAVRTEANPAALISSVRAAIRQLDAELPLNAVGTIDNLVDSSLSNRRFAMLLMAIFASLALAMVGIYGVMSSLVMPATREIGIGMALGARSSDVLRMVLRHGGLLMAVGLLIGIPMAFGAGKLLASQLFDSAPQRPGHLRRGIDNSVGVRIGGVFGSGLARHVGGPDGGLAKRVARGNHRIRLDRGLTHFRSRPHGKYHHLKVRLTFGAHSDLQARGYVAKPPATEAPSRKIDEAVLVSDVRSDPAVEIRSLIQGCWPLSSFDL